jgi:molybdenum cofactor cytidylyltransferase
MTITAIVLAAGRSTRFGADNKLLADAGDGPLIRRVLAAVAASPVDDIVVVTGLDGGRVAAAAGPGRWHLVTNPEPDAGLSSSIRAGIGALAPGTDGVLIVLGDMPGVTADLIAAIITAFEAKARGAIVFPQSPDGRQGHPVLWPRSLFTELASLTGDTGGKALIAAHCGLVSTVPAGDGERAFLDIDTEADLARFRPAKS